MEFSSWKIKRKLPFSTIILLNFLIQVGFQGKLDLIRLSLTLMVSLQVREEIEISQIHLILLIRCSYILWQIKFFAIFLICYTRCIQKELPDSASIVERKNLLWEIPWRFGNNYTPGQTRHEWQSRNAIAPSVMDSRLERREKHQWQQIADLRCPGHTRTVVQTR